MPRLPLPLALPVLLVLPLLLAGLPGTAAAQKVDAACANFASLTDAQRYAISDLRAAVGVQNWSDAAYSAQALKNVDEPHTYFWFAWLVLEGRMRGDLGDAVARMRRVAEHGCPMAQSAYSVLHAGGKGVPQNWAEAYKWAVLAADKNDPGGIKLREDIAKLHPEAVAEGTRLAAGFKPSAWTPAAAK
jgi:TPR repeat protein